MPHRIQKTICWSPIWRGGLENVGLEYVVVSDSTADSTLLAVDECGQPFCLIYHLKWDQHYRVREADFEVRQAGETRQLSLRADGVGHWQDITGDHLSVLDGCIDIDIWPTPLTNSLPIWRSQLQVGQRQEFHMAWISAPQLSFEPKPQAYARLGDHLYLFESLDESDFQAQLPVDAEGLVLDYPLHFRRVPPPVIDPADR